MRRSRFVQQFSIFAILLLLSLPSASAQISLPDAKPVPRMQVIPLPYAQASIQRDGATLVPLKLYFNDRGIAKLLLGLAVGKRKFDKRETEKRRDWERQKARLMRDKG